MSIFFNKIVYKTTKIYLFSSFFSGVCDCSCAGGVLFFFASSICTCVLQIFIKTKNKMATNAKNAPQPQSTSAPTGTTAATQSAASIVNVICNIKNIFCTFLRVFLIYYIYCSTRAYKSQEKGRRQSRRRAGKKNVFCKNYRKREKYAEKQLTMEK